MHKFIANIVYNCEYLYMIIKVLNIPIISRLLLNINIIIKYVFFHISWNISSRCIKKLYYNNGSVNIRYHGKQMTSLKDLLLWLTCLDICRGRTVARKCKFDFVLQLGICLSIPLNMEIDTVRLLMSRACMSNVTDTS